MLYQTLGNLSAIAGFLQQILPSLTRSAHTGGQQLELYDSEGGNPAQQLKSTPPSNGGLFTRHKAERHTLVQLQLRTPQANIDILDRLTANHAMPSRSTHLTP